MNKPNSAKPIPERDPDAHKGATESDQYQEDTPVSMTGQLPHRTSEPMVKDADSDFPEPGGGPEHTGEPEQGGTPGNR